MTAEKLQRANEIQDDISNFKQIRLISLVDGSVKVVTNNVNGAYLNKRVSEDVKNALEDILSKYQKELESL